MRRPNVWFLQVWRILAGRETDGEMADLHGPPVASPAQPAVHDQAAADSLIEDTDHHEVGIGVVDLVDGEHRQGVDVVLDYHRDGPVEAGVSLEEAVQLIRQRDRLPGPVVESGMTSPL